MPFRYWLAGVCLLGLLAGCARPPAGVVFHASANPEKLSDWGVLRVEDGRLSLAPGVQPYALNTPLFSDYAHKLRTLWLPAGKQAQYDPHGVFAFPVGTVITKTFYYPRTAGGDATQVQFTGQAVAGAATGQLNLHELRLVETRVLVRRESGWIALPYVWNAAQTDAVLTRAGDAVALAGTRIDAGAGSGVDAGIGSGAKADKQQPFTYLVPDANQCASCHATDARQSALSPIGLAARHLNRQHDYLDGPENQLARFSRLGWLSGAPAPEAAPRAADWQDPTQPLAARARAYLDINCSHCHHAHGPADTSALRLDATAEPGPTMGLCKPPVAAGQGTGDHRFGIVPGHPEDSILVYRMRSEDPGAMMPELGRAVVHAEGVALVSAWISSLPGDCR